MSEEDLEQIIHLRNERDRMAAKLAEAVATNEDHETIEEAKADYNDAVDEFEDALNRWEVAD